MQPFADWTLAGAVAAAAAVFALTGSSPLSIGGRHRDRRPRRGRRRLLRARGRRARPAAPGSVRGARGGDASCSALPFLVFGTSEGFGSLAAVFIALYTVGSHAKVATAAAALALYTAFWLVLALQRTRSTRICTAHSGRGRSTCSA